VINNQYKFYQNKKNAKLDTLINSGACIWNHCVSRNKRFYKRFGKNVPKKRMRQQIAKIRKRNPYWKQLNSQSVQEIVDRFYLSFDRFFKKIQKRPPKMKKWKQFKSFIFTQSGFSIENNVLTINKIGKFKVSKSRAYTTVQQVRVSRDRCGDFFLTITSSSPLPKTYEKSRNGASVGVDFGLKTFLTLSDGVEIDSPQFYKKYSRSSYKIYQKLSKQEKQKTKTKSPFNAFCKQLLFFPL
jgi:putative transposase